MKRLSVTRRHLAIAAALVATIMTFTGLRFIERAESQQYRVAGPDAPWAAHIKAVDEGLENKDIQTAEFEWHRAYLAALGARRWEGKADVGDAALRIGEVTGSLKISQAKARRLFLAAFFLAREQGSVEGVLRASQAFIALGDREVAAQCLRTARDLATRKGDAEAIRRASEMEGQLQGSLYAARTER